MRDRGVLAAFGAAHALHLGGYDRYLASGAVATLVTRDGRCTLVVPTREVAAAEAESDVDAIAGYGGEDVLLAERPAAALAAACRELVGREEVVVAGPQPLVDAFSDGDREPVRMDAHLARLRRLKDPDELGRVVRSCELALLGQRVVEEQVSTGAAELTAFAAAHAAVTEAAGRPIEWIATVAGGVRSTLISPPFCVAEPVPAIPPVLCDIAVRHRGYWGDTARTYGGDEEVEAVRAELTALRDRTAAAARPGVPAQALFESIRAAIAERFPDANFPHHGGHGLGIEISESPQLLPWETAPLEAGMVLAIEPAAYFPGRFGVRVENTYRIAPEGAVAMEERSRE